MKKVITFLKESNRLKHLVGGIAIGAGAEDWYCAMYAGIGVAAALELKDELWGGHCDCVDFGITVVGVVVGQALRQAIRWVF